MKIHSYALVLFLAACSSSPEHLPKDKKVVDKYTANEEESRVSTAGNIVYVPVTHYYLVSSDNMVCDVDGRTYAHTEIGSTTSCVWEDLIPP